MRIDQILGALALVLAVLPNSASARANLNDMQTCQAGIAHILEKAEDLDDAEAVLAIKTGLEAYDAYIQSEIIDPGLLEFTSGDQAKADAFQVQIDAYKAGVTAKLGERYAQPGMFTDYVVMLDRCSKMAAPAGADAEALMAAAKAILAAAQSR